MPTTTLASLPNTTVNAVTTDAAGNIYIAGYQGTPTGLPRLCSQAEPCRTDPLFGQLCLEANRKRSGARRGFHGRGVHTRPNLLAGFPRYSRCFANHVGSPPGPRRSKASPPKWTRAARSFTPPSSAAVPIFTPSVWSWIPRVTRFSPARPSAEHSRPLPTLRSSARITALTSS